MPSWDRMGIRANEVMVSGKGNRREEPTVDNGNSKVVHVQQFKYTRVSLRGMKRSEKTVRGRVGTVRTKKAVR